MLSYCLDKLVIPSGFAQISSVTELFLQVACFSCLLVPSEGHYFKSPVGMLRDSGRDKADGPLFRFGSLTLESCCGEGDMLLLGHRINR